MIYTNTPQLKRWLEKDSPEFAQENHFTLDDDQYRKHLLAVGSRPESERPDAAAFRCLTFGARVKTYTPSEIADKRNAATVPISQTVDLSSVERHLKHIVGVLAIIALILLAGVLAHAQTNVNPVIIVSSCGTPPAALPAADSRSYLTMDTNGRLCVATTGAAGGTSMTDNSAFTGGTDSVTPMGAIYDTTPPTITDGRVGAPRMDSDRYLYVNCITGCAAAGDTTGTTVSLNVLNETAQVALSGTNGANFHLAAGTLTGTFTPEISYDGGSTWGAAVFINPVTAAVVTSQAFTNPNAATDFHIGFIGPATHARVRLSAVTSGTADGTLRATTARPFSILYGSDGSNIRQMKTDSGGAIQVDVESGTITTITDAVTVTDGAGALNVIVDSGTLTAVTTITNAVTVTDGAGALNVIVDSSALPTGAATEATLAGTLTSTNFAAAFGTAGVADTQVMSIQGIASMTPILATVSATNLDVQIGGSDTVTVTATNLDVQSGGADLATEATLGGVLTSTNFAAAFGTAGTADTQVMSIQGIASMTPILANPGTAANWGVYVEDAGETAGGNLSMAGTVRRDTMASSAGTTGDNATLNTDANGLLWARFEDPCSGATKSYFPVDIVTATTTEIANAVASQYFYICGLNLFSAGTNNVTIVEDDTDACATPTAGLAGGVTAGEGYNFTAQTGLTLGNGTGSVMRTAAQNRYICIITSAAVQLSGTVVYVAAP